MTNRRALRAAPLLLAPALVGLALGCATLGAGEPGQLRDAAQVQLDAGDLEGAYRTLARIRIEHPDSPEAREVFPAAARIFKREWWRHRYREADSPWLTSEPAFLFDWLASFYAGDAFPQREAEFLLLGMPVGFLRDYQTFAAARPELARWRITGEDDNGVLESIAAARAD